MTFRNYPDRADATLTTMRNPPLFFLITSEELADITIKVMIDRSWCFVKRRLSYPLPMSRRIFLGRSGFTLIELIAVLAIIGVLASLSIPRFIEVESSASRQALVSTLAELNSRENLTWSQVKLSATGWVDDAGVFLRVNTDMGPEFRWAPPAALDGGKLYFKEQVLKLERKSSQPTRAGKWAEKN